MTSKEKAGKTGKAALSASEAGNLLTRCGDPVLRVVPRPADINSNGHIFGGWVLSQMDIAGGIVSSRAMQGHCATVAIEAMEFIAPILLRDVISVYAEIERVGRTSMGIRLDVIANRAGGREDVHVTSGLFTFVALDENHRPRAFTLSEEQQQALKKK